MTIKFYKTRDPHGYMSNYWKAKMFIYGRWWICVESPYQAAKTNVMEEKDAIWAATKANDARLLGQTVTLVPDWDQIKRSVMMECVLAKFLQHPCLRQQLMETGDEILIEDSPYDSFWGLGPKGDGQNMLGQVLMEVRTLLGGE
jgi:N-glycosidase YbiA